MDTKLLWRLGWAAGVGVEIPIAGNWTARAEYLSTGFGSKSMTFPAAAEAFEFDLAMQSIRLGVNYRIGDDGHVHDIPIAISPTGDPTQFSQPSACVDQLQQLIGAEAPAPPSADRLWNASHPSSSAGIKYSRCSRPPASRTG